MSLVVLEIARQKEVCVQYIPPSPPPCSDILLKQAADCADAGPCQTTRNPHLGFIGTPHWCGWHHVVHQTLPSISPPSHHHHYCSHLLPCLLRCSHWHSEQGEVACKSSCWVKGGKGSPKLFTAMAVRKHPHVG